MKNRSNEIRSNEIRIRREPSVVEIPYLLMVLLSIPFYKLPCSIFSNMSAFAKAARKRALSRDRGMSKEKEPKPPPKKPEEANQPFDKYFNDASKSGLTLIMWFWFMRLKKRASQGPGYLIDVLWCQPIKLIQVVSTSEFHEY